jgi:excisionase family DNA binding protein
VSETREAWVSKREVAEHLGVAQGTVDRLMGDGLPHVKVRGGRTGTVRFRLSDVDAWMTERSAPRP